MKLTMESGAQVDEATEQDIFSHIEAEEFLVLERDGATYLQCAEGKEPPYDYVLEYQEGSLSNHFQAVDDPITLDRVKSAMLKYLRGDASWKTDFRWQKLDLG
jgi:hypothetical protein